MFDIDKTRDFWLAVQETFFLSSLPTNYLKFVRKYKKVVLEYYTNHIYTVYIQQIFFVHILYRYTVQLKPFFILLYFANVYKYVKIL